MIRVDGLRAMSAPKATAATPSATEEFVATFCNAQRVRLSVDFAATRQVILELLATIRGNLLQKPKDLVRLADINRRQIYGHPRHEQKAGENELHRNPPNAEVVTLV